MSDGPAIREAKVNIRYLDIAVDYLLGLPYLEIQSKYKCNNGYIQYALEQAGVETNRIKSRPRFNGYKKKSFSKELIKRMKENSKANKQYDEKEKHLHCTMGKQVDNNPVHVLDDLDIMERLDGCDGVNDLAVDEKSLQYEIVVTEEGEVKYEKDSS